MRRAIGCAGGASETVGWSRPDPTLLSGKARAGVQFGSSDRAAAADCSEPLAVGGREAAMSDTGRRRLKNLRVGCPPASGQPAICCGPAFRERPLPRPTTGAGLPFGDIDCPGLVASKRSVGPTSASRWICRRGRCRNAVLDEHVCAAPWISRGRQCLRCRIAEGIRSITETACPPCDDTGPSERSPHLARLLQQALDRIKAGLRA